MRARFPWPFVWLHLGALPAVNYREAEMSGGPFEIEDETCLGKWKHGEQARSDKDRGRDRDRDLLVLCQISLLTDDDGR
jgi:hypothetical protein